MQGTKAWNHQLLSTTFSSDAVQVTATPVVSSQNEDILMWKPEPTVNALPKPFTHIYRAFATTFFQLAVPEVSLWQPTSYYRRYGKVNNSPFSQNLCLAHHQNGSSHS
jgi:hypothetical protein